MASDKLASLEKNKPGAYQGTFDEQIQAVLDKIMNQSEFSYDMNADPLYQQYKNQYTTLGQSAMRDTIGNAAALTGDMLLPRLHPPVSRRITRISAS